MAGKSPFSEYSEKYLQKQVLKPLKNNNVINLT